MSNASTFSVISTGQIHDDFGLADVQQSFAKLFKITPEKASAYVGVQKILKKDLEHTKAQALKSRLESIGMVIALKEHKPAAVSDPKALSIEEMAPAKEDTTMTCPKCNLRQEKAEQCSGCGVYVNKLLAPDQSAANIASVSTPALKNPNSEADIKLGSNQNQNTNETKANATTITQSISVNKDKSLNIVGVAAAAGAAVVGALLWKYITVWFGYEFAIIAIGIGAAVGIAAVMFESEGIATGVICAVFTLLSIFGGKYMATSSLQESWAHDITSAIAGEEEIYQKYYQQDLKAAEAFGDGIEDKEKLIAFLNDHGYLEIYAVDEISDAEIADFNEFVVPHLKRISETNPSFEEWLKGSFEENIKDLPTATLMFADFGIMGIVFLFLGIGTAFKMGMGGD